MITDKSQVNSMSCAIEFPFVLTDLLTLIIRLST